MARYGQVPTLTLSIMINPRVRAIREAKAKLLRAEREGQQAAAACIALAAVAMVLMLVFIP